MTASFALSVLQASYEEKCEYFFSFFLFESSAAHVMFFLKLKPDPIFELVALFSPFTFSKEAFWEM